MGKKPDTQKFLPKTAQLFYILCFDRPDPQGREIAKYWGFRPFWPRAAPWHLEKFRAENRKTRFPGARSPFGKKTRTPKSFSRKLRNIFTFCVLTDRTPRGGKSQNTVFLGPFGLGQPLGTERNSGLETAKRDFPELGAFLGKTNWTPKSFSRKLRNFLHFAF